MNKQIEFEYLDDMPKKKIEKLHYYYIIDAEGNHYTIERDTLANRIGCIVSNADLLGNKDVIDDIEFDKLNANEVVALHKTYLKLENEEMEML